MRKYRSPLMSALWSIAIPGFGQLYIGDYLIGVLLVVLELIISVKASINLSILYSLRGQFQNASGVVNFQWMLFYPCIYAYSIWQAYNRAMEINHGLSQAEKGRIFTNTQYNGFFVGSAMGGTLGVIYSYRTYKYMNHKHLGYKILALVSL
ncbi:hypothetical protein L9W92_01180 [Pelotomaculum terephthalicicum JT]|uniref:hypothetical protein n=1 Tax=Pelotomaculum terephthalicicum TaxID=206393 RepID=UPI001F035D29|nr:hypothetical protein [Pelotomaculum terephthalicicum]MCG9966669.1 hypothetical protein [Pelotomaculum terephthalicicum JT]